MLRIAAIIVTFNRKLLLEKTIKSLSAQTLRIDEIIIVDNNSQDGTEDFIRSKFSGITYLKQESNLGPAEGFGIGMAYAHSKEFDWIWMFNDDSRPKAKALEKMISAFGEINDESLGMIKVNAVNEDGQSSLSYWKGVRFEKYVDRSDSLVKVDLASQDGLLINKKVLDTIGYYEKKFFMTFEDTEYALRATAAGFSIYVLPNGMIEDEKAGSSKGSPVWRSYYTTRNHLFLALKYKSFKIFVQWIIRESKFALYSLLFRDQKLLRIKVRIRAIADALGNKMGKTIEPQ